MMMSVPLAIPPGARRFFDETQLTTNVRGRMGDAIGRGAEIGAPNLEPQVRKPKAASLTAAYTSRYAPRLEKPAGERAYEPAAAQLSAAVSTVRTERLKQFPHGWIERPDGTVADLRSVGAATGGRASRGGVWIMPALPSESIVVPRPFSTKGTVPGEATQAAVLGVQTF